MYIIERPIEENFKEEKIAGAQFIYIAVSI
jgi:hypothetical protein